MEPPHSLSRASASRDGQVATIPVVTSQPRDGTQAIQCLVPLAIPRSRAHRVVDSRLKVVGHQLTLKGVKMAFDIVQAYNSSTKIESLLLEYDPKLSAAGGKASQATPETGLAEWTSVCTVSFFLFRVQALMVYNRNYKKLQRAILDVQTQAIRSAALISGKCQNCPLSFRGVHDKTNQIS